MESFALIGLLIGFILFVVMITKGVKMFLAVMVAGGVLAVLSGMDVYTTLTTSFFTGFTSYIMANAAVFIMGSVFGSVLGLTGASESLARWAIKLCGTKHIVTILILVTTVLVYGGVNLYVIIFTLYPICLTMFKEADLPRRVIPGLVYGGCCVASFIPGAPQTIPIMISNALGVSLTDCFVVGLIGGIFSLFFCPFIVNWLVKKYQKKGEHFESREGDPISANWDPKTATNPILALLCMAIMVFLVNFKWPSTGKAMPTAQGMFIGTIITIVVLFKWIDRKQILSSIYKGIDGGMNVVITVSTVTGFGYIVKESPAFDTVIDFISNVGGNPMVGAIIGSAVLAACCASASGGLGILLPIMSDTWLAQTVVTPAALYRVMNSACATFDSLPHNGFVNSLLGACDENVKSGYEVMWWVSVIMPTIVTAISYVLLVMFPGLQ